tara:strand:- start:367 stop:978 length:612 start_codon:yes stop_codon:yes gene_type:complete
MIFNNCFITDSLTLLIMKKILLLLLFIPIVSFGQDYDLGNYTKVINKNIEFSYKKPLTPFLKADESFSLQGNTNLVTAFYVRTANNIVALQIYATTIPSQFQNLDWEIMINNEQQAKEFLNSFLGAASNTAMKISKHRLKTVNGNFFLEVKSTLTMSGVTQKQINWITVYKNTFINILGATLINSFDKNLPFFEDFSDSVLIN